MTEILHLTPRQEWEAQAKDGSYAPEAFAAEGFIHCTDGDEKVVAVGNRYYRGDARPFVCLVIESDRVHAPVRYDDQDHIYPHIYGRLNTGAVVRVRDVRRAQDGTFLGLGD